MSEARGEPPGGLASKVAQAVPQGLFAALVWPEFLGEREEGWEHCDYKVFLVNDSDADFANVASRSGEFISTDTTVYQGNVIEQATEPLRPHSARCLYFGRDWELDFVQWWHLDFRQVAGELPTRLWFQTSLGTVGLPAEALPVLGVEGRRLALSVRTDP